MKKVILLCIGIAAAAALNAQTKDSVYFQAFYKLDYVKDLLKPQNIRTDEMLLSVGNSTVSFYSYKNFVNDSLREANPNEYQGTVVRDGSMTRMLPARTTLHNSANNISYCFKKSSNEPGQTH